MTCRDARQWLSDLLDDALGPERRVEVKAHLAGCAECRVELDRLRATVAALGELEPVRAPAGFVDRVVQRAYPVPWHRRLGAWLFLPLSIKLPVEAAAVVVIAGLAMLVWERSPELRSAARQEPTPLPAPSIATIEPTAQAPAPTSAPPAAPSLSAKTSRTPSPELPRTAPGNVTPSVLGDSAASTRPAPETKPEAKLEAKADPEAREEGAPKSPAPPAPAAPAGHADRAEIRPRSASASVQRLMTKAIAPSEFSGRLIVRDRDVAAGAVSDLLTMIGGRQIGRREDDADTVIDAQIPEARYDDFVGGLNRLGWLTTSGRPTVLPLDPPQMRLTIRLGTGP